MGGGTIRAAAKVAGVAATTGGFRGIAAEHLPVSAARKAGSAFPATSKAEDVKLVASKLEAGAQRPCLEIDDWVFAGGEEDEVEVSVAEPMPRVVFGGVPSLQEAKEATSELSVALEKAYLLSPDSVGHEGSVVADNDSCQSLSNKQLFETKACVASEAAIAPAVPAPAIMAFRFLHESSMAQNVVASVASDPNVWNAVSQNKELQDFLQSQKACSFSDTNSSMKLVADSDLLDCSSPESVDDSSEPGSGFTHIFQKIKSTVVDMMNNLSDYFQSLFGGKGANGVCVNSDGSARLSGETFMEASFMGLAVMAIIVILLKRD